MQEFNINFMQMILYSYVNPKQPLSLLSKLRELSKIYSLTINNSKLGIMPIKYRNNIKASL